jgi:hypothetical protein
MKDKDSNQKLETNDFFHHRVNIISQKLKKYLIAPSPLAGRG